ncbi:PAS/PAC sensor signal transduction histidine kinase [Enterobacillus tribolii]|uniref:histidine kinase n=1 Tax=Enterobacillus tribolii TaxID=1487935 RepID=A0A370QM68_9GAMM|nr:two-component system sensor histidine kinase AtoS [Enterobacillus tribolii]RDK89466.1 PAS/PAC sensor signal transduction histidine kinase [Enterobacillus tribolii]
MLHVQSRVKRLLNKLHWPQTLRQKMVLLAILVSLPTLTIGFTVEVEGRNALLEEKRIKLFAVTRLLDNALGDSFSRYPDLPREQRLKALNALLAPVTDKITQAFSGVGAGYYHRGLDAIVTYGPQAQHGASVGITISPNHPGREVMESGEPVVGWGTQVRGNIMNAMIPIVRENQVIGYIWANELSSDIDQQALAMDIRIMAATGISILLSVWIIIFFSRRFSADIDTIKSGLNELPYNLHTVIPPMKGEMGEISDSVNHLSRALREAKTLNELIIESAADGVISVDIDGRVTMINPAAEKITGYQRKELLGRPYAVVFENTNFHSPILDTLEHGIEQMALEVNYPGKNRTIQISVSTSRIHNARGETIGALVIFSDLTEKKEVQHRIAQAERLAALGELMAGVAHEVRNPLTAISGFVQLLKDGEEDARKREYTHIILNEVNSINKVIQQLLDFARPRCGRMQQVSLNQLITETLILIKTGGSEARIDFNVCLEEGLPDIDADGEQLKQVLLNLLINAVQAIPCKGNITITTRRSGERHQEITIRDSGQGISEESISRIFDPFYTTKPSGTGLGLPICQRIIALHDGDIRLESRPGHGTTFIILLPVHHGAAEVS